ncbi:hypothetical protein TSUD_217660 [Trifolium subterraneum]|uniref:Uncharacterized protein n=1 Tax=Trifolium subterraneum TaxID=3900 RepID=A0A2Z6NZ08_TRISU|nr:hypothetical protein TSUD_217660 [Trifolium subterraneum]
MRTKVVDLCNESEYKHEGRGRDRLTDGMSNVRMEHSQARCRRDKSEIDAQFTCSITFKIARDKLPNTLGHVQCYALG